MPVYLVVIRQEDMFCLVYTTSCVFFFFKQKAAYERRIGDWSSDVCSSDLLNVVLAVVVLREHLPVAGQIAVALAAVGVGILGWQAGAIPWIALGLAVSFSGYGLIRRSVPVAGPTGLSIEMLLLAPLALLWILLWGGLGDWPGIGAVSLLALGGPVTAIPLTLFAFAARRLPFATIGLLQFVAPTMIFLQGAFVYGEQIGSAHV